MKNICVFLSANNLPSKYTDPACEFGRLLVENQLNYVWGGSDNGLMTQVAQVVKDQGGVIIGVTMKLLAKNARIDADKLYVMADFTARKKKFLAISDAFVVMPGGTGTLDEVSEIIEFKKHNLHNKPIIFLNTDNFWQGFKAQLEHMQKEGFLTKRLADLVTFADTPAEAILLLRE